MNDPPAVCLAAKHHRSPVFLSGWLTLRSQCERMTSVCTRKGMLAIESYRPSIISPAPGRYVNVGTDCCLCSCSSLVGARTCSSGRLSSAPQPISVRSTPKEIADFTRIILPPVCPYGLLRRKKPPLPRVMFITPSDSRVANPRLGDAL
jgi:hypothetical protein